MGLLAVMCVEGLSLILGISGLMTWICLARALRQRVLQWTGIPTCVGLAPMKTLAKFANFVAQKRPTYRGVWRSSRAATSSSHYPNDTRGGGLGSRIGFGKEIRSHWCQDGGGSRPGRAGSSAATDDGDGRPNRSGASRRVLHAAGACRADAKGNRYHPEFWQSRSYVGANERGCGDLLLTCGGEIAAPPRYRLPLVCVSCTPARTTTTRGTQTEPRAA